MTIFRYKAMTASGTIVRGEIEAPSEAFVINHLRREGHYPISTKSSGMRDILAALSASLATPLSKRVSLRTISDATQELADLLQAGLELDQVLGVLLNLRGANHLQQSFAAVRAKIRDGMSLGEALAQEPVFPKFYVGMVRAGEMGGMLTPTLRKLAQYLTRSVATREAVFSALVYPLILLVTAGLSISFILGFVIPSFAPLFATAGQALPLPTQIAMDLSLAFQRFWWLGLALIVSGTIWFRRQLAKVQFRRKWHGFLMRLPLVGTLWIDIELERFKRILGTLVSSGVALPAALRLSRDVMHNLVLADIIGEAAISLREGDALTRLLAKSTFVPAATLDLIRIGEETGRLDEMLIRQADLDESRIRHQIDRLIALLVPTLTIVLGIIVAALIASMLVAILSVNNLAFQ